MGGTTAKICLLDHGEPLLGRHFEVDRAHRFMKGSGIPLKIPVVEMVEIGAGGGSIASVDRLKRIRVGSPERGRRSGAGVLRQGRNLSPRSRTPTCMLGRLDAAVLRRRRLRSRPRRPRGPARLPACRRSSRCRRTMRSRRRSASSKPSTRTWPRPPVSMPIERGREIQDRTMIAFGGAAPRACGLRVAEKLGIRKVVVPVDAGVGSAVGFLLAPVAYEVVRSRYQRLSGLPCLGVLNDALRRDERRGAREVVALGRAGAGRSPRASPCLRPLHRTGPRDQDRPAGP